MFLPRDPNYRADDFDLLSSQGPIVMISTYATKVFFIFCESFLPENG